MLIPGGVTVDYLKEGDCITTRLELKENKEEKKDSKLEE